MPVTFTNRWKISGGRREETVSHLLQDKLPDVVSQLVFVQMRTPCVIREVIGDKVVHPLFQVQVSWLQKTNTILNAVLMLLWAECNSFD